MLLADDVDPVGAAALGHQTCEVLVFGRPHLMCAVAGLVDPDVMRVNDQSICDVPFTKGRDIDMIDDDKGVNPHIRT